MKKLASYNYDILDHVLSGDLSKVASVISGLSKEAQGATIPDFDEQESRPATDFALVIDSAVQGEIKKFAKYDKELTEINMAFLEANYDELPQEIIKTAAQNLKTAATEWNLPIPEKIASVDTPLEYCDPRVNLDEVNSYDYVVKLSSAEESPQWALPEQQKYPIGSTSAINSSIDYFNKYANDFMPSEALQFANNVKKAALEKGVDFSDTAIEKFASLRIDSFNEDMSINLKSRKRFLKEADYKIYDDIQEAASDYPATKIAQALERADMKLGIDEHWGRGITNPAFTVFGAPMEKSASDDPSLEDLRGIDRGLLTGIVGSETVSELRSEDGVVVFRSLPRPIKKEVLRILAG